MSSLQILAISGSLRKKSSNRTLLEAMHLLAPPSVKIIIYQELADLPHFNPDLEELPLLPTSVIIFRHLVKTSDGLLFSTPEYAHGLPGSFKNALDWLVGGEEFYQKPIALLNASAGAVHAQQSLMEIVKTMGGIIVSEASYKVRPFVKFLDADSVLNDPETIAGLVQSLKAFEKAIRK